MIQLCKNCPETVFLNVNHQFAHVETNSIFCGQPTIGDDPKAGLGIEVWETESPDLVIVGTAVRAAAESAALRYYTDFVEDVPDSLHEAVQDAALTWINRDHPGYEDEIWPDDVKSDVERPGDSPALIWTW